MEHNTASNQPHLIRQISLEVNQSCVAIFNNILFPFCIISNTAINYDTFVTEKEKDMIFFLNEINATFFQSLFPRLSVHGSLPSHEAGWLVVAYTSFIIDGQ